MTATNHALTGALIGLTFASPLVALPLSLVSHLVCDSIPHFGLKRPNWIASRSFRAYLLTDALLCIIVVLALFASGTPQWVLASACAFAATSPDLLWIRKFKAALQSRAIKLNPLEVFLDRLQWFQRPIGALVELAWFAGSVVLLWQFL